MPCGVTSQVGGETGANIRRKLTVQKETSACMPAWGEEEGGVVREREGSGQGHGGEGSGQGEGGEGSGQREGGEWSERGRGVVRDMEERGVVREREGSGQRGRV